MKYPKIFRAIDITVWYDNAETMHKFEETCLVSKMFIESNLKKINNFTRVTGGFDDGHVEVTYPIKRNKTHEFARTLLYYDIFFNKDRDSAIIKLVG